MPYKPRLVVIQPERQATEEESASYRAAIQGIWDRIGQGRAATNTRAAAAGEPQRDPGWRIVAAVGEQA